MLFLFGALLAAQNAVPAAAPRDTARPVARAVRVASPPSVDGRLDESAWAQAPVITRFTQVDPRDGATPGERTEVRIVYDDEALYIGARLLDSQPRGIVARLGRRDEETNSDAFGVAIDSYHDHRTAFRFEVNAAGVKRDNTSADDNSATDDSWDPVWDVATRIDSAGWTAELRIPFSQLRFSSEDAQTWGIDFTRYILRTAESVRWSWAPRTESGYISQFGHLEGLSGMSRARGHRAEVMPYLVTQGDFESAVDPSNPFGLRARSRNSVGADFKYGINSGLTLTGTINPDFGQVEADPAEVNLTVFETYFVERRPFFVEGANLFRLAPTSFGAPTIFYSRRIGRPPSGGLPGDAAFADVPEVTSIRGAAKLSGKIGAWRLGVLDAVSAAERADVMTAAGLRHQVQVEPRTNYAIAGLRRDFRGGRSGIGFLGTSVIRSIDTVSLRFLRSSAHVAGADFFHRFGRNRYNVNGTFSMSGLRGDPASIMSAQRSSARYFQRPDQDYVRLDSAARTLSGYNASLSAGKVAGEWLFGSDFFATSPGFEINDVGFQQSADRVFHGVRLTRRWLTATKYSRFAQLYLNGSNSWNFGGTHLSGALFSGGTLQLLNNWTVYANGVVNRAALNDRVLRGGPLVLIPSQWSFGGGVDSDSRRRTTLSVYGNATRNKSGGYGNDLSVQVGFRPTTAINFSFGPSYIERFSAAGFVSAYTDAAATTTFGRRYIVSSLHQRTVDLTARANVALTSTLSLQLYTQPFVSSADYSGFKAFLRPVDFTFIEYGKDGASTISYDEAARVYRTDPDGAGPAASRSFGNPDFRLRSLRSNLVVKWEYRPGSTLYFAWAHGREAAELDPTFDVGGNLRDLLGDDQRNRLLIKASYWFNP